MTQVASFTFNPLQENTYIVYDETKECVIIDPGCYSSAEEQEMVDFIEKNKLNPVRLLNTHCHLDHVFGNKFIAEKYNLELEIHKDDLVMLEYAPQAGQMYGIPMQPSPAPSRFIEVGETITFGNTKFEVLFTPGHSPGSISFYCAEAQFVIAGDVLFRRSIGRTQGLPMTDVNVLMTSIREQLYTLPDATVVYAGHMGSTTIGEEKRENPYVRG